jgi:hypothetical protein
MSGGSGTTNPSLASHLDASHIDLQAWVGCQEATHIGTVPSHSLAHEEQRKGACQSASVVAGQWMGRTQARTRRGFNVQSSQEVSPAREIRLHRAHKVGMDAPPESAKQ